MKVNEDHCANSGGSTAEILQELKEKLLKQEVKNEVTFVTSRTFYFLFKIWKNGASDFRNYALLIIRWLRFQKNKNRIY